MPVVAFASTRSEVRSMGRHPRKDSRGIARHCGKWALLGRTRDRAVMSQCGAGWQGLAAPVSGSQPSERIGVPRAQGPCRLAPFPRLRLDVVRQWCRGRSRCTRWRRNWPSAGPPSTRSWNVGNWSGCASGGPVGSQPRRWRRGVAGEGQVEERGRAYRRRVRFSSPSCARGEGGPPVMRNVRM